MLHSISYIPRKHLPHVTFRQRRVDKEKVMLPPQVYEERRGHYERRVEAMLRYAEVGSDCCRSRQLLQYFGEEAEKDCGICDVCTGRRPQQQSEDAHEALRNHILSQLQQGPCNAFDLDLAGFNSNLLEEVIDQMRAAGEVSFDGPLLTARTS